VIDLINSLFEGFAAFAVGNHCRVILKHREAKGMSILSTVFFTAWGFWNMYYYPVLGQMFSFWAGAAVCAANAWYVYLLVKFRTKQ
jgi:hypothetical protein